MSEHWPKFLSERRNAEPEETEPAQPSGEESSDSVEVADGPVGERPSDAFLAELVRTVQTTAGVERERIAEDTERRRQAHIDRIRARQAAEEERMRDLAGQDKKAIDAWADGERRRIELERERRATKRQEDLDASLGEHTSKIDREVEAVESAIARYRADVDGFFGGIDRETDLVLIAQQATRRPVFPSLDVISETAIGGDAAAQDEPAVVGVMDPQALAEAFGSWEAAESGAEVARAGTGEDAAPADQAREGQPVAAASEQSQGSSGSLFQSTPVLRPMSRFRRDNPDDAEREG